MHKTKRSFLKTIAAVGTGAAAGLSKFFLPEARADIDTSVTRRLRSQPDWQHQHLENEDLRPLYLAVRSDPEVIQLLALAATPLYEVGPIRGDRYLGDYPFDAIRIPYTDSAGEEIKAWILVDRIDVDGDQYDVKSIALKETREIFAKTSITPIGLVEESERTAALLEVLFDRPQEEKNHQLSERRQLKGGGVQAPCLPQDCETYCSTACDVGTGFLGGTIGLELLLAAEVAIPPGAIVATGITALAFGTACINCNRHCNRFNRDCCQLLKDLGLVQ